MFVVVTWQNVEKFKGGEYFCKPLYNVLSAHMETVFTHGEYFIKPL